MYFPFFRGRQSELLALRRLLEEGKLSSTIIPIIEPIKPTATLRKTLECFIEKNRELIFVSNPMVGSFKKELNETDETSEEFKSLINNPLIKKISIVKVKEDIVSANFGYILKNEDSLHWFIDSDEVNTDKLLLVPYKPEFRRSLSDESRCVLHADYFKEQARNADYLKVNSYVFSSDHKHYKAENYYGFSDYSIVGSSFMEGGFAPRAVAIHMVYLNERNDLCINHFTSVSNTDMSNPAGKYHEALMKLIEFFKDEKTNNTYALNEFRKHDREGTYPGLGVVKQLSIMHHLELIGNYLEEDDK